MTTNLQPLLAEVAALVLAQKVEFEMQSGKVMITKTKPAPRFAALVDALTEQCKSCRCKGEWAKDADSCNAPGDRCESCQGTGRRARNVSAWPKGALEGAIEYAVDAAGFAFQDQYEAAKGCGCGVSRWDTEAALRALKAALEASDAR